jgi:hypothetical protein
MNSHFESLIASSTLYSIVSFLRRQESMAALFPSVLVDSRQDFIPQFSGMTILFFSRGDLFTAYNKFSLIVPSNTLGSWVKYPI